MNFCEDSWYSNILNSLTCLFSLWNLTYVHFHLSLMCSPSAMDIQVLLHSQHITFPKISWIPAIWVHCIKGGKGLGEKGQKGLGKEEMSWIESSKRWHQLVESRINIKKKRLGKSAGLFSVICKNLGLGFTSGRFYTFGQSMTRSTLPCQFLTLITLGK